MSRAGITFEQVELAAEKLLSQGENPTIEKVRHLLGGTGSNSTLSKHLNEWRSHRLMTTRDDLPAPHIPPDPVHAAVNRVWKEIHDETALQIQQIREQAKTENDAIKKQIEILSQNNKALSQERDSLQALFNQVSAEKEITILDLKAASQQNAVLEERCQSLEQQYQVFKEESTARLSETSWHHQQEIARLEGHSQTLQKHFNQSLSEMKSYQETLRHQYMLDVDALKTEKQKKEKTLSQLTTQIQKQQSQIESLETHCQQLVREKKETMGLLAEQKKQMNHLFTTEFEHVKKRENQMIEILKGLQENILHPGKNASSTFSLEVVEKKLDAIFKELHHNKQSKQNKQNKKNDEKTFWSGVDS